MSTDDAMMFATSVTSYAPDMRTPEQWRTATVVRVDMAVDALRKVQEVVAGAAEEDVFGYYNSDPQEDAIEATTILEDVDEHVRAIRLWLLKHPG